MCIRCCSASNSGFQRIPLQHCCISNRPWADRTIEWPPSRPKSHMHVTLYLPFSNTQVGPFVVQNSQFLPTNVPARKSATKPQVSPSTRITRPCATLASTCARSVCYKTYISSNHTLPETRTCPSLQSIMIDQLTAASSPSKILPPRYPIHLRICATTPLDQSK